jgi:hypothetical protein
MGRALVNKGGVQKSISPDGKAIINRVAPQSIITPNIAPVPSKGIVNRNKIRPDIPLAATTEPKMII